MIILQRAALASAMVLLTGLGGAAQAAPTGDPQAVLNEIAHIKSMPIGEVDLPIGVDGKLAVFVEFAADPAALVYSEELASLGGAQNPTARAEATRLAQIQLRAVEAAQGQFLSAVAQMQISHDVLFRAARSINGVALRVQPAQLEALRQLGGVKRVEVMYPEELHNSTSTPFIGAPQVWSAVDLVRGSTGAGVRIGIIDTGIDYQHAHFGGTGALEDYQANDRSVISDQLGGTAIFPTAKVVGGFDFAGDAYTGGNAPVADPDPMDCNGHGSHVAGSAAGYGVTSAGLPYAGPFDASTDYGPLRIGPGVAPQADLYALRVFGCTGSTNLTVAAIEWAMDPNADGDFSDRLDVINMSLGSNFGDRFNATALAADNAAKVGVIVVASAGNASDTFFITGAPGVAGRGIAVASSLDSAAASAPAVRINTPANLSGFIAAGTASFGSIPPPGGLSGNVVLVDDGEATLSDGCTTIVNAAAVAGNIALIDRGVCGFQIKAGFAQAAGAIGVIIANNAAGAPPGLGATPGADPVTIPTVSITLADANAVKAALTDPGVNVTLFGGGDMPSSFTSRGPRRASPIIQVKPDVAAPGQNITSAQTGITGVATYAAGSQPLTISGTSMAAPHVAGVMALLHDIHPDLSTEEYKALLMNTARREITSLPEGSGSRHGGSRVGAGRVDVPRAAAGEVLAFNAEDPGLVSVSFESGIRGTVSRSKTVRLVNRSAQNQTFDVGIDTVIDAPGIGFSTGSATAVVPANGSTLVTVQMDAVASEITHFRDPTLAASQAPSANTVSATLSAAVPRHFMTEESARLTFSQGGEEKLRVPVYAAVYPESTLGAADVIATGGAGSGSTTLALSGQGVCTGELAGSTCTKPDPLDQGSLVTAFELQGVSPRDPFVDPSRDIRFVGAAYTADSDRIHFGFASWGPWSSPTDVTYRIDIDCGVYTLVSNLTTDTCAGAPDGLFDLRIVLVNRGTYNQLLTGATTSAIDVFQVFVIGLRPGRTGSVLTPANHWLNSAGADLLSTRTHFNEVQFVPISRTLAKISGAFSYRVGTCFGLSPLCSVESDSAGPYTWDHTAQGLNFNGSILADAQAGTALPVSWDSANMAANGSLGALLLHHFNGAGSAAEIAVLEGSANADGALAAQVDNPTAAVGSVVTVTLTVTNSSGTETMNGASVAVDFPAGTQLLGDNGAGTFDSSNWVWTIGNLAPGASANLNLLLRVTESGAQRVSAQLGTTSPVDANLSNNNASVWINATSAADLAVSFTAATNQLVGAGTLSYTIALDNLGPDQAFNVSVAELFVAGGLEPLAPATATASIGSYDGTTGIWSIPAVSATSSGSATLTLAFTAPPVSVDTTATLRISASADTSDPNTGNNVASAQTLLRPIRAFRDGFEN